MRVGVSGHGLDIGTDALHQGDQLRPGVFSGIAVEEPVDVGENHQQVGFHEVGDQGREVVVVAEADLVDDHRVVFVDDRDDAVFEEGHQGVAGVEVAPAVGQIVAGEEDLAGGESMGAQSLLVGPHQPALADGRRCLLEGDGAGAADDAEIPLAGGDRSRGDDDHLVPLSTQFGDVADDSGDDGVVEAVIARDDAAADLDDDPADVGKEVAAHDGYA